MELWIAFILGAFAGTSFGVLVMALVIAGKRADEDVERMSNPKIGANA